MRMTPFYQKLSIIACFTLAAGRVTAQPGNLHPWASITPGTVLADETASAETTWTSMHRNSRPPRLVQTLNRHWTFNYLPKAELNEDFTTNAFDDSPWSTVSIPHTWHTFETTGEVHPFTRNPSERDSTYWWNGWGCYRKQFELDAAATSGKRIFVEFDGVMKYCKVWCNGRFVGGHKGGYGSFHFELTEHITPGRANTLAVAVNARRDDIFRTPPMTAGNFNVYGGIYRDVRIMVKSAVHIPYQGAAQHEGGTFITTPSISTEESTVRVRTWTKNSSSAPQEVTLRTTLRDPDGRVVQTKEARGTVAPGIIHLFDQNDLAVPNPQLWSIEKPHIYQCESEVLVDGKVTDRLLSPFGVRTFEWNHAEKRGYLNGERLHIHGQNRHQEFPWLGDAVPKWIHVRDLHDMKFGQGHNFARFGHYTQDPLVIDLADRYGILVCEEVPNIKSIDFDKDIQRQQVIEMIRRDRNHPSIVMWSMGNETSSPADSAWAHAEDTSRIIHVRHSDEKRAGKFVTHTDKDMDMENLLRCTVRGWTDSAVANLKPVDGQHVGTEQWQHQQARIQDSSQRGRIDMSNGVMWLYADHGADREYLNSPLKHINPKGWVDLYRVPKYLYYLWQANYTSEPMVFIHPHSWQTQQIGKKHDITVDSNCDEVELLIGDRSFGTLKPTAANFHSVTFRHVPVEKALLTTRATRGGKPAASATVAMAGPAARLALSSSHASIPSERSAVALVTTHALDASGNPVLAFSGDITWKVEGPAKLVSPQTYQTDIKRRHAAEGTFYTVTPICAVVRATGGPGAITVTASSPGVLPARISIQTTQATASANFVKEASLSDAGRKPVARAISGSARAALTGPMKPTTVDLSYPAGKGLNFYREQLVAHFQKVNPEVLKRNEAAPILLDSFAESINAKSGLLVADDYNFQAVQFNDYCKLEDDIRGLKLPTDYLAKLPPHFAREIVLNGRQVDPELEIKWLRSISGTARTITAKKHQLSAVAFQALYPEASGLTTEQKARAIESFRRVNQASISTPVNGVEKPILQKSILLVPPLNDLLSMQ